MDDRFVWFNFNADFSSLYKAFGGYYNGNAYYKNNKFTQIQFQLRNFCNANDQMGNQFY